MADQDILPAEIQELGQDRADVRLFQHLGRGDLVDDHAGRFHFHVGVDQLIKGPAHFHPPPVHLDRPDGNNGIVLAVQAGQLRIQDHGPDFLNGQVQVPGGFGRKTRAGPGFFRFKKIEHRLNP